MADYRADEDEDDEELARMQADIEKQEKEARELAEIANAVSGTHPATLPTSSTSAAGPSTTPTTAIAGGSTPSNGQAADKSAAGAGEGEGEGEADVDVAMLEAESREEVDARSVHVGNVDYAATPEEIQQFFQACGSINRVTILCDKFTGHPKGYAYVEFADVASVANAVVLNESTFRSRQLSVQQKRTNQPAFQRGGGRGGGGPRGRGRGGYRGGYRARGGFSPYGRGRGRGRGAATY